MSLLLTYLNAKRSLLAHDYQANCLTIAHDIAGLLIKKGGHPFIICLHKEEARAGNTFHYPLIPKKYNGRITWTKHYACCCDEIVYDPLLEEPIRIEEYSNALFAEDFPIERIAPEEANLKAQHSPAVL